MSSNSPHVLYVGPKRNQILPAVPVLMVPPLNSPTSHPNQISTDENQHLKHNTSSPTTFMDRSASAAQLGQQSQSGFDSKPSSNYSVLHKIHIQQKNPPSTTAIDSHTNTLTKAYGTSSRFITNPTNVSTSGREAAAMEEFRRSQDSVDNTNCTVFISDLFRTERNSNYPYSKRGGWTDRNYSPVAIEWNADVERDLLLWDAMYNTNNTNNTSNTNNASNTSNTIHTSKPHTRSNHPNSPSTSTATSFAGTRMANTQQCTSTPEEENDGAADEVVSKIRRTGEMTEPLPARANTTNVLVSTGPYFGPAPVPPPTPFPAPISTPPLAGPPPLSSKDEYLLWQSKRDRDIAEIKNTLRDEKLCALLSQQQIEILAGRLVQLQMQ